MINSILGLNPNMINYGQSPIVASTTINNGQVVQLPLRIISSKNEINLNQLSQAQNDQERRNDSGNLRPNNRNQALESYQSQYSQNQMQSRNPNFNYDSEKSEQIVNVLAGQGISLLTLSEEPATIQHPQYTNEQNQVIKVIDQESEKNYHTEIFSWGSDQAGQLGLGQNQVGKSYSIPKYCTYNITIKQIACGDEHAIFIAGGNLVYSMGSNQYGQLGIGDQNIKLKNSPILVESLMPQKPVSLACGSYHSVLSTDQGEVYSWGQGIFAALGSGNLDNQVIPVKLNIMNAGPIIQVSAGMRFSAFLDSNGRLFTCGQNEAGQLGTGEREQEVSPVLMKQLKDKVRMVACGQMHTLLLTQSGHVYSCGANSFGQLGLNNKRNSLLPLLIDDISHIPMRQVAAGSFSASVSHDTGDLFLWGSGIFGEFLTPHRVKTIQGQVVQVDIGNHYGMALSSTGNLYSWGHNTNGELGQGDLEERPTPQMVAFLTDRRVTQISCGRNFTIALGQTLKIGEQSNANTRNQQQVLESMNSFFNSFHDKKEPSQQHQQSQGRINPHQINQSYFSTSDQQKNQKLSVSNIQYTDESFDLRRVPMAQQQKSNSKSNSKTKKSGRKQKVLSTSQNKIKLNKQNSQASNLSILNMLQKNQKKKDTLHRNTSNSQNYTPIRSQSPMNKTSLQRAGDNHHSKQSSCALCMNRHHNNHCQHQQQVVSTDIQKISKVSKSKESTQSVKNKSKSKSKRQPIRNLLGEQIWMPQQQIATTSVMNNQREPFKPIENTFTQQNYNTQPHDYNNLRYKPSTENSININSGSGSGNNNLGQTQIIVDNSQLIQQLDISKQLRDEVEQLRYQLDRSRQERLSLEEQVNQERQLRQQAEASSMDYRLQLQSLVSQNEDLKINNERLMREIGEYREINMELMSDKDKAILFERRAADFDKETQRLKVINNEREQEIKSLHNQVHELEVLVDKKRRELVHNEGLMVQYGENLKELEMQFQRREEEIQALKDQNIQLKSLLDEERQLNASVKQIKIAYEEEVNRRVQSEKELDRVRNEYYDGEAVRSQEIDNLRRAVDDLRYQREDSLKILNLKDTEISNLQKDIEQLRDFLDKQMEDSEQLKAIIEELEQKNRRLNDKLNEVIFTHAAQYKEKTMKSLNRQESPDRVKRMNQYGITEEEIQSRRNKDYDRLEREAQSRRAEADKNASPQRSPDPLSNYRVMQELEKFENSNQKSPIVSKVLQNQYKIREKVTPPSHLQRQGQDRNQRNRSNIVNELYPFHQIGNENSNTHEHRGDPKESTQKSNEYHNKFQSSPLRQKLDPLFTKIIHGQKDSRQDINNPFTNQSFMSNQNTSNNTTPIRNQQQLQAQDLSEQDLKFKEYQEKMKSSCEKLANALGLSGTNHLRQQPLQYSESSNSQQNLHQPTFITGISNSASKRNLSATPAGNHLNKSESRSREREDSMMGTGLYHGLRNKSISSYPNAQPGYSTANPSNNNSQMRSRDRREQQQQSNDNEISNRQELSEGDQQPRATQMTSSMIKKSLHDLRQKLDVMRKDKEAVENGILEYETKNNLM